MNFKETLKRFIGEYNIENMSSEYLKSYSVQAPLVQEIDNDVILEYTQGCSKVVCFAKPKNIMLGRCVIYINKKTFDDYSLTITEVNNSVYIYGDDIEEFSDPDIKIVYYDTPLNISQKEPKNTEHISIPFGNDTLYLLGTFINITLSDNTYNNTDYLLSDYIVGVEDGVCMLCEVEHINAHSIKMLDDISKWDDAYILVFENQSYYAETIENFTDKTSNTHKDNDDISTLLRYNDLASIKNEKLIDYLRSHDYGLYRTIINEMGLNKIKNYKLKNVMIKKKCNQPINSDRLEFNLPKFYLKVPNRDRMDIEIFYNGKLYNGFRTVIKGIDYTHIYIGVEEFVSGLDFFNGKDMFVDDIIESIIESDIVTVVLKENSYVWDNFRLSNEYQGYIYLPCNYKEIYNVKFYLDGRKLNDNEYDVTSNNGVNLVFFKNSKNTEGDILTITGHKNSVSQFKKKKLYNRIINEKNMVLGDSEIYMNGILINPFTVDISTGKKLLNIDGGDIEIYYNLKDSVSSYDYRDVLLDGNITPNLSDIIETADTIEEQPYNEEAYQLHKFYTEHIMNGDIDINEPIPSDVFSELKNKYPLLIDGDNFIIDCAIEGLPSNVSFPWNEELELLKLRYDEQVGNEIDDVVSEYFEGVEIDINKLNFYSQKDSVL